MRKNTIGSPADLSQLFSRHLFPRRVKRWIVFPRFPSACANFSTNWTLERASGTSNPSRLSNNEGTAWNTSKRPVNVRLGEAPQGGAGRRCLRGSAATAIVLRGGTPRRFRSRIAQGIPKEGPHACTRYNQRISLEMPHELINKLICNLTNCWKKCFANLSTRLITADLFLLREDIAVLTYV